jgi:hypothetical protein
LEKVLKETNSLEPIKEDLRVIIQDRKINKTDIPVIIRLFKNIQKSVQVVRHGNKEVIANATSDIIKILVHAIALVTYPEEDVRPFFDAIDVCIESCAALIDFHIQQKVKWGCKCC